MRDLTCCLSCEDIMPGGRYLARNSKRHLCCTTHAGYTLLTLLQPINISCHRTFQQAGSEPLGEDWGKAEMQTLLTVQASTTTAIRRAQSNADPFVAGVRQDAAQVVQVLLSLPEGETRQRLAQALGDLRVEVEAASAQAQLPLTTVRAGKVDRRQNGRPEGQRKVTALFPNRKGSKKRSLVEQATDHGDDFEPRGKAASQPNKVQGFEVMGGAA